MKLIQGATIGGHKPIGGSSASALELAIEQDRRNKEEQARIDEKNAQIQASIDQSNQYAQEAQDNSGLAGINPLTSTGRSNLWSGVKNLVTHPIESAKQIGSAISPAVEAVKKPIKTTADTLVAEGRVLSGYDLNKPEQRKKDIQQNIDYGTGIAKNVGELGAGITKAFLKYGTPISGLARIPQVASFIDDNGILNYHPNYTNEIQQTGGEVAELGSWLIPLTRWGKVAKIEEAISEIPKVAEFLGTVPKIVKTGGQLFFEASKDAVDVGLLDSIRGKDWGDIKKDAAMAGAGGVVLRGGGKVLTSLFDKAKTGKFLKTIENTLGTLDEDEQKLFDIGMNEGKPIDEISNEIMKKRVVNQEPIFNEEAPTEPTTPVEAPKTTPEAIKTETPVKTPITPPQEGGKFKSAEEAMNSPEMKAKWDKINAMRGNGRVTKTSNNLYHTTSAENLDSIRKNGLTAGNKARFEGVSSPNKISFSANEKGASYYGKDGDVMIRTKTSYKPTDLQHDLLAGGEGTYTTGKNIPPEMLEVKINGKWQPLSQPQGITPKVETPKTPGVAKAAHDINVSFAKKGMETLPEEQLARYNTDTKKIVSDKIATVMDDWEKSKNIVLGKEKVPEELLGHESPFFESMAAKAQKEGDYALMRDMASSPMASKSSELGKQLGETAWFKENQSVTSHIRDILKSRLENATGKVKGGAERVYKAGQKEIKTAIKKVAPTKETWSSFIESIKCK